MDTTDIHGMFQPVDLDAVQALWYKHLTRQFAQLRTFVEAVDASDFQHTFPDIPTIRAKFVAVAQQVHKVPGAEEAIAKLHLASFGTVEAAYRMNQPGASKPDPEAKRLLLHSRNCLDEARWLTSYALSRAASVTLPDLKE